MLRTALYQLGVNMAVFLITFSTLKITIMKLISLAKKLDFTTEDQYFDYCIESFINGQRSQCYNLFFRMRKEDRKELLKYITQNMDLATDRECYDYYFNLL